MTLRALLTRVAGVAGIFALALAVYLPLLRPWQLRWGATDEELSRVLPGDEIVPAPSFDATRAVTVRARPEEIWPWIVQIGDRRAGFYSYDWFDNRGRRSAERILPELQRLEVGDRVPISAWFYQTVHSVDPPRSMVWVNSEDLPTGTWTWVLEPLDATHTRLITRMRSSYDWTSPMIPFDLWLDWGDFPFMRKSLLGIEQRAEGEIRDSFASDTAEGVQWAVAFLAFVAAVVLMMRRREWWRPWAVGLASAAVFALIFYGRPPLWLGTLLEVALLLALIWSVRATTSLRHSPTSPGTPPP